jgi:hypothetical protein
MAARGTSSRWVRGRQAGTRRCTILPGGLSAIIADVVGDVHPVHRWSTFRDARELEKLVAGRFLYHFSREMLLSLKNWCIHVLPGS